MGRFARAIRSADDDLQSLQSLAQAGVWDKLMDAIVGGYAGDVQMIDSSIVRVHQQGATAKRGVSIDVWAVYEAGSPPKSMRLSTPRADRSISS